MSKSRQHIPDGRGWWVSSRQTRAQDLEKLTSLSQSGAWFSWQDGNATDKGEPKPLENSPCSATLSRGSESRKIYLIYESGPSVGLAHPCILPTI
jgi:hypothetical protein